MLRTLRASEFFIYDFFFSLQLSFHYMYTNPCMHLIFRTPLMLAVAGGHVDAVSLLLERDANVNFADNHGLTALHLGVSFIKIYKKYSETL